MCRVERITYIYPDGRYLRQPYFSLCHRSESGRPCDRTAYYDLGERVLVRDMSSNRYYEMEEPPPRNSNHGLRRTSTTQQAELGSSKLEGFKPAKKLPSSNAKLGEEVKRTNANQNHAHFAPAASTIPRRTKTEKSPVTLSQPDPPPLKERPRRPSVSRPSSSYDAYASFDLRQPKQPQLPSRRNSTSQRHSQQGPSSSHARRTSFAGPRNPPSPILKRATTAATATPPKKASPTPGAAADEDDETEMSRFDHRAAMREAHAASAKSSDELLTERQRADELARRLKEIEDENKALKNDARRKKHESEVSEERVREIERRLAEVELRSSDGSQAPWSPIFETRRPGMRQEIHHDDKGGRYVKETPRRYKEDSTIRDTYTSSGRTLRSDGRTTSRTTSSQGSVIDDETQEESDRERKSYKKKKKYRRSHHSSR